ncbi:ATP-binding cassette domain-containing protein [Marinicrinis lubricantis]|uniref:ATP-binding cassette domain-containing protein n=1 Tax=Marinicrinis lubricantis TaxID=2086470 RepID=A0ABW1IKN9_9BACL
MNQHAIEVKGLRKMFGQQVVLDDMEFSVEEGTIFALLGPNGAGKTTLIHILSTLLEPDGGFAKVNGYDVSDERNMVKRSISLTGQYAAVDENLTGAENLRMMCRLSGLTVKESRNRSDELLEKFDLTKAAQKLVRTYSGGMRRRLDLAISLVVNRPILFLDEPTTGLDTRSRQALWSIKAELKTEGITIFLTTQYLEEADQLADIAAVINRGRVVAMGTPKELKSRVGNEIIELRDENDEIIRSVPTKGTIEDVLQVMNRLKMAVPQGARVHIRRPSMDDAFLALTEEGKEVMSS